MRTEVDRRQLTYFAVRKDDQHRGPGRQADRRNLRPARVDADADDRAAELDCCILCRRGRGEVSMQ